MMPRVTQTPQTIWTVGHGQRKFDEFTEILADHDIAVVIDIRSKPIVRFSPHFNQKQIEPALVDAGFQYLFLGDLLGGRPTGDRFYDADGHTAYDVVSGEPWFKQGIEQVEKLAATKNVALTCLEEKPEDCHRHLLVGKILTDRGAIVEHVRHAGYVETQAELDERMGVTAASFVGGAWRSPIPMKGGHGRP